MFKARPNKKVATPSPSDSPSVFFERMEPKILLSADALSGLVSADPFDNNDTSSLDVNESVALLKASYGTIVEDSIVVCANQPLNLDLLAVPAGDSLEAVDSSPSIESLDTLLNDPGSLNEVRHEIIFIDAATPDYQSLVDGLKNDPATDYQVFILDSERDGIEQISEILGGFENIDALHLVSHGNESGLQLGSSWFDNEFLASNADVINNWSSALSEQADLMIYGCNLAAAESGQQLISELAGLTGADVAASDDFTGAAALGGDWILEYTVGQVETGIIANAEVQQNWGNVLGTINVTTTDDVVDGDADLTSLAALAATPGSDGFISLREAILAANADIGLDTIVLDAGTYDLSIAGNDNDGVLGDLDIKDDLVIQGAGATSTIIDGNAIDRVFEVVSFAPVPQTTSVWMYDLTITDGGTGGEDGGALNMGKGDVVTLTDVVISGNRGVDGGGVFVDDGDLILNRVEFIGNTASGNGGAMAVTDGATVIGSDVNFSSNSAAGYGGAIDNLGSVSLKQTLFFDNDANIGGAISNAGGIVDLVNATISANTATTTAGAINNQENAIFTPGTVSLTNSTLTGNTSAAVNGILQLGSSSISLLNSILNDGGSNLSGGIITSAEYTIDSDNSAALGGGTNLVGNPLLDVLADNGGFTQTHALLSGSIAFNAGTSTGAPIIDQRGVTRDSNTDIGAYEVAYYLDQFNAITYNGDDGSLSWSNDWQELGEADGAGSGNIWVTTGGVFPDDHLVINLSNSGDGVTREADLSAASIATLEFDYGRQGAGSGTINLDISDDGGVTWTTVSTYFINTTDAAAISESIDISAFVSANTQIRFEVASADAGAFIGIDNIAITLDSGTDNVPTTSGIADVAVNENAVDTVIDLFAAFDDVEDIDADLVYTIQNNTNGAMFTSTAIDGVAGTLTLDYAAGQSGMADITVRATDTGGQYVETTFTVSVNAAPSISASPSVFINELHYDNAGIDTGEAIEIMAPAGTDLTGWSLVLYSGADGLTYDTEALSGVVADQSNGFGTLVFNFPVDGIENGVADGIALVNAGGTVVQFISYEGVLTALDGPASGLTSTDIGVAEDGTTLVGDSLQLTGTGSEMTWSAASANTFGALNTGQNVYAVDNGLEDTDNVYTHAQMLTLLGASDSDDADTDLTIDITNVVNGTLTMSGGTGGVGTTFTFTPDLDFNGQLTFDYQVFDDDSAASAIGNGIINIAADNDEPVLGNNTLTLNQGDIITIDSSMISATDVDNASGGLSFSVSNVSNGYFAYAADTTTAITSFTQDDITTGIVRFVHDGGELAPAYDITVTDGSATTVAAAGSTNFTGTSDGVLWLSTDGNEGTGSGITGLDTADLQDDDILQQADPNFSMGETTTDGAFSIAFNASDFAGNENINGMHYVTSTVTIGSGVNAITLLAGDLILTNEDAATFVSNGGGAPVPLTVDGNDIFIFRPDTPGDYSTGNFYLVLDDPFQDGADIHGISLVEKDVWVGDTLLSQGDLLLTRSGGSEEHSIWLLDTSTLDPTIGASYPAAQLLIEGSDVGVDIEDKIFGIDILEQDAIIGGQAYDAGTILISIDGDDTGDGIGITGQFADRQDVIALSVTKTTLGSGAGNAIVTASIMFDGDNVNFDSDNEMLDGFTLTHDTEPVNIAPVLSANSLLITEGATVTVTPAMLAATDADGAEAGIVFNISGLSGGQFELTGNPGVAITSFTQAQLVASEVVFVDNGDETSPAFNISVSDGVDATAPVAAVINFTSVNDAPVLSTTADDPTFTDGGAAVSIFSGTTIDTIEVGQSIDQLVITVTNVADGADEIINLDGDALALINTTMGTTVSGYDYSIVRSGATATITIITTGATTADIETLINNMTYQNDASNPTEVVRVVTIESITDSGGVTNGGVDTAFPGISSMVDVVSVNVDPVLANAIPDQLVNEDAVFSYSFAANSFSDADGDALTYTATLADGSPLPSWLTFDAATRSFSGTPLNADVGTISIRVTADDGNGGVLASDSFDLQVVNTNDAPTATSLTSSANYDQGDAAVALNDIVISDVDSGETVTATLTLANVDAGSLSANDGASYNAATGVWTITGSVADVNAALANLSFVPVATNVLNTTVAVSIDDNDEDSSGPLIGAMNITVNPAPVVVDIEDNEDAIDSAPEPVTDDDELVETELPAEVPVEQPVDGPVEDNSPAVTEAVAILDESSLFLQPEADTLDIDLSLPGNNANDSSTKDEQPSSAIIRLREQLAAFSDPLQLVSVESFIMKLNDMREELVMENEGTEKVIGGSLSVSAGLSVGYVVWLARSGIIMSSVLSSLPAWRLIDPLPVLATMHLHDEDEDQESLESMVEEKKPDDNG